MSFLLAGLFTFLVAHKLFDMDPEVAAVHGLLVGTLYPVIMTIVMTWAKVRRPALYARLRISRRRPNDNKDDDPDDTGTFFFTL